MNISSGTAIVIDFSSKFFPCNKLDILFLIIKALSIVDITFSESEMTIRSRFMMDDLKKVVSPKINNNNIQFDIKMYKIIF